MVFIEVAFLETQQREALVIRGLNFHHEEVQDSYRARSVGRVIPVTNFPFFNCLLHVRRGTIPVIRVSG